MWQNRIYALIIRRILGPYLTPTSRRNLQKTLDISLYQGRVSLHSLELDGHVITEKLKQSSNGSESGIGINIKNITVDELNISLFLVNDDDDTTDNNNNGNEMTKSGTRMNNSGATTSGGSGVRLVAKVELNGVHVKVQIERTSDPSPNSNGGGGGVSSTKNNAETIEAEATSTSSTKGFIQSYIQAALNSLKLSLDIHNLSIQLLSTPLPLPLHHSTNTSTPSASSSWVTLNLKLLSYKDSSLPPPPSTTTSHDEDKDDRNRILPSQQQKNSSSPVMESNVILGKEICFDQLSIEVSSSSPSRSIGSESTPLNETKMDTGDDDYDDNDNDNAITSCEIMRYNGIATVIATIMSNTTLTKSVSSMPTTSTRNKTTSTNIERHLEIALDDTLNVHIQPVQLQIIHDIIMVKNQNNEENVSSSYSSAKSDKIYQKEGDDDDDENDSDNILEDDDEQDLGLLSNILKEQQIESSRYMSSPSSSSRFNNINEKKHVLKAKSRTSSSIDDFFHTNQEGYAHYCNLLASSIHEERDEDDVNSDTNQYESNSDCDDDDDNSGVVNPMTTTICLYMKEVLVNIQMYDFFDERRYESLVSSALEDSHESLCLTIIDLNVIMSQMIQRKETEVSLDMKEFMIEHIVSDNERNNDNVNDLESFYCQRDSILQFIKAPSGSKESSLILEKPNYDHVVTLKICSIEHGTDKENAEIHIVLAPLLISIQQETIEKMTDTYKGLLKSGSKEINTQDAPSKPVSTRKEKNTKLKFQCKYIAVEVPLFTDDGNDEHLLGSLNDLFGRSGYTSEAINSLVGPTIAFSTKEIDMDMLKHSIGSELKEVELSATLQKSVVSIISPIPSDKMNCRRFDLISIDSETQIDPDAIIKIEYSNVLLDKKSDAFRRKRAKKYFPLIVPLASVKASQQFDNEDMDANSQFMSSKNKSNENNFTQSLKGLKRSLRGTDPQIGMLKEASFCESNVLVSIPSIALDLTTVEKDALLVVLSRLTSESHAEVDDETNQEIHTNKVNNTSICIGLSLQCNQFSLSIHHDLDCLKGQQKSPIYTQLFVMDGLRVHLLLGVKGLKHVRFVCQDVTLYEVNNIFCMSSDEKSASKDYYLIQEMSDTIRKRRFGQSNCKQSSAVIFRSKLSHPLSPKTPALLVDMIIRRQEDDPDDVEKSLHISLYDLTYRHDLESCWVDRLKTLVGGTNESETPHKKEVQQSENTFVTNIFCTMSDCNLDFSSPDYFNHISRIIMRVGEVRVTSNLISPSGPIQTYKMSIGNVSVNLSNTRNGHEVENSRISCSRLVFNPEQLAPNNRKKAQLSHSLDDALFRMNFIAIATLDYLEAALTTISEHDLRSVRSGGSQNSVPEADSTLALSAGRVCLYACKDSFDCLTGTLDELILKLTMPTSEELDVMRAEYFSKQESKLGNTQISSLNDEESVSSKERFIAHEAPTLNDVMNHGLFSDEDIEIMHSDSIMSDDGSKNRSRTSTLSTIPDCDLPLSSQLNDRLTTSNSEQAHEVIQDFYEVGNPGTNQKNNHLFNTNYTDCWTAVDHPWAHDPRIPDGQEQAARWYSLDEDNKISDESTIPQLMLPNGTTVVVEGDPKGRRPRIFNRHIPLKASPDPLSGSDMGASSYAGTKNIQVKLRILVTDISFNCRLFDGHDWPALTVQPVEKSKNIKSRLMGELMGDQVESNPSLIFSEGEDNNSPEITEQIRKKARQSHRYFQMSFSGLKLRLDSLAESEDHYLASCLELNFTDMILIETISSEKPVKLLSEWVNEEEYPRDSNDGLLMMKIVTLHPENQFAADGKLMGDEGHAMVEFLPIRFFIHQIAIRFIRQFFASTSDEQNEGCTNVERPPDMFFPIFKVKPFDIKVDYKPLEVDRSALKEGSYIQLLNLLPLEDMILRLNGVEMRNLTGWGAIISELACKWLQDVSSTQMHKFLTRTTPLHPFANVGDGMKNFVLIPLKEYKQKGNVQKALRKSTSNLVGVVAYEALSVGAKLTGYAAKKLKKGKHKLTPASRPQTQSESTLPRNMGDVSDRAIDSLSRGLKEANATIIIMPYREYQKTGTKGAMKKVVKGIPVAICAPLSGAVEALSHSLYGASNQLRPDLFEEREASKRFHDEDF